MLDLFFSISAERIIFASRGKDLRAGGNLSGPLCGRHPRNF